MSWHAKPYGSYERTSPEGRENMGEMNFFFNSRQFTLQAQAGIIGNVIAESGLNPWRWQDEIVSPQLGYGLFQFTPASAYLDGCSHLLHYAPNLSTYTITDGASPDDAIAQLTAFADDVLGKWVSSCWRPYWDVSEYNDLYELSDRILTTYGDGTSLTLANFANITNVYDATFAFLACYEGPTIPNMEERYDNALVAYDYLTNETPDDPVVPVVRRKKSTFFNSKFAVLYKRRLL